MGTHWNNLGEAVLTSTHNLCFKQKHKKYQNFLSENFSFLIVEFSIYLNRRFCVMHCLLYQIFWIIFIAPDKAFSSIQKKVFFLLNFLHKNICCGYSLEVPHWGTSNGYPHHIFSWRNSQPRWLNWMRRPTGDQEIAGSTPARVGNILSWRLIIKYFLRSFSRFRWFKKGSCQFLVKECARYWLTA